ncbi:hypothetical protein GCM10020220_111510 [Nonomuraea rubra]|uniref:hypothetical protein n=1 Tax=Nonomuraea rubra TaxID=46180 RepID=UPI0031EA5438
MAIGTSLTVHPAAGLCGEALDAGARLVIVNAQPPRMIRSPIASSTSRSARHLPALVKELIDAGQV